MKEEKKNKRKSIQERLEEARLKLEKLEKQYEIENKEAILEFFSFMLEKEYLNKIKDSEISKDLKLKEEIKYFISQKLNILDNSKIEEKIDEQ